MSSGQPTPTDLPSWLSESELPVVNKPTTIIAVSITFQLVAWLAVSFRLYTRFFLSKTPGWDDFFVTFACVVTTAGTVILGIEPAIGLGQHMLALSEAQILLYLKLVFTCNGLYVGASMLIKISILLQYLRVFTRKHRPRIRWTCIGVLVAVVIWGLGYTLATIFSCNPISKTWNILDDRPGYCVLFGSRDPNQFFAAFASYAASNMLFDLIIFAIPIPFWRDFANRNKRSKAALVGLFSIGAIVVALSAVRLGTLVHSRAGTYPVYDLTWYGPPIFIASILEVQVAILCASMPIFWPVIPKFGWGKIFVFNEISVRSEAHRRSDVEKGKDSYDDSTELRRLPSAFQKDDVLAGWGDPLGAENHDGKRLRPYSTRVERTDPPMREYREFAGRYHDDDR